MTTTPTLLDVFGPVTMGLADFSASTSTSVGSQGIGQTMGPMLASDGGMPGMMAGMGMTTGHDMGQMLRNAGGMKHMMTGMGGM